MPKVCTNLNLRNPLAEKALRNRLTKIKGVNQTVRERLRRQILLGLQKGEATEKVADRIRRVFRSERFRARMIARTEINAAANDARDIQVRRTFGNDYEKEWITARDPFVRDAHQIDGERVKANEHFSNGLTRPHDPTGPPGQVINCRCILVFHPKEEMEIEEAAPEPEQREERQTEIQTLIFPKRHWTLAEARQWCKDHDFKSAVDETSVSYRFRQQDPSKFQRLRTWCMMPRDANPSETRCRVKAVGGPHK